MDNNKTLAILNARRLLQSPASAYQAGALIGAAAQPHLVTPVSNQSPARWLQSRG